MASVKSGRPLAVDYALREVEKGVQVSLGIDFAQRCVISAAADVHVIDVDGGAIRSNPHAAIAARAGIAQKFCGRPISHGQRLRRRADALPHLNEQIAGITVLRNLGYPENNISGMPGSRPFSFPTTKP